MTEQQLQVANGRLKKKIEKLKKQRDYWKKLHDHYANVISLQPFLETRYKRYEERIAEQNEKKHLTKRVKEQEILIRILTGDTLKNYEIDVLYSDLIKEEYKNMNENKEQK